MTFRPLVIDTAQTNATGLYTLYTKDGKSAFTFDNPGDVWSFSFMWFDNRRAAVEAYTDMVRILEKSVLSNNSWHNDDDYFFDDGPSAA